MGGEQDLHGEGVELAEGVKPSTRVTPQWWAPHRWVLFTCDQGGVFDVQDTGKGKNQEVCAQPTPLTPNGATIGLAIQK